MLLCLKVLKPGNSSCDRSTNLRGQRDESVLDYMDKDKCFILTSCRNFRDDCHQVSELAIACRARAKLLLAKSRLNQASAPRRTFVGGGCNGAM